jgi:hypothetical protein
MGPQNFVNIVTALALVSPFAVASPEIKVISVEPEQFAPETTIQRSELFLITNITLAVIRCSASYPVQWQYQGYAVCFAKFVY